MMSARPEFMDAAFDALDQRFGSEAAYLEALGVDSDAQAAFRGRMLVQTHTGPRRGTAGTPYSGK